MRGSDLYSRLAGGIDSLVHESPNRIGATSDMSSAGIPGIKYKDAGSRGMTAPSVKPTGDGFEVYWGNDPKPVDKFPSREAAEAAARELDGSSRNYVVFDENLINIVKKYGVAGAATMLGMTAAEVEAATYDPIAEIKSYLDGLK